MKVKLNSIIVKVLTLVFGSIIFFCLPLIMLNSQSFLVDYGNNLNDKNAEKVHHVRYALEKEMLQIETAVDSLGYLIEHNYPTRFTNTDNLEAFIIQLFTGYLESDNAASYSVYTYFEPESESDVFDVWLTYQEHTILRHEQIPYQRYVDRDNMTWFYDVKESSGHWVKPYRNRYDEYITSYVKPVNHEKEFVGIIGMYLDINKIRDMMVPLNISDSEYYWAYNADKEIIYHPILNEGSTVDIEYDIAEQPPYVTSNVDDVPYRHYLSVGNNNWTYVLSIKESTLFRAYSLMIMKNSLSVLLFLIVLASFLWLFMKQYTKKIHHVISALSKAQTGNYSEFVPVASGDEIGTLSHVVNETLDKVGNTIIKLERICYYNTHTGLANLEKLKYDLKMYSDRDMALYLLDLDNFRVINDILGKTKSDSFIKEISEKLREAEEHNLYVYHTSGDEFAFLEFDPLIEEIATHAEFIINLFRQLAYSSKYQINVSTSIGVAKYPDDVSVSGGLIECAHVALSNAKKEGKDNFKLFSRFLPDKDYEQHSIYNDLRKAIQGNDFILHYQKIFDRSKECVGYEALVRWEHPDEGLLYPNQFIDHIETSGLISEFNQMVLKMICSDYSTMVNNREAPKRISMNLSHRQLLNPLFISNTLSIIRTEHLTADFLAIEITEDILRYDLLTSKKKLDALRVLGIHIDLDDFGTGDASLNTLLNLPITKVKIDGELITQVTTSDHMSNLVRGIINLCHQMNYIVTAESVEDEETFKKLYEMGCDEFQGFYFDKPKPYIK